MRRRPNLRQPSPLPPNRPKPTLRRRRNRRVRGDSDGVLNVPDEFATIQDAVDAAVAGDLVLIAPGVYNEAVDVVTDEIVIRGLEREGVVLDGAVRTRQRHPGARRQGRRGREPHHAELHRQRRVLHLRRRLPGVVRDRLPHRRLRRVRVRLGQRSDRALVRCGQPRRRAVHRPVLPVQRRRRRLPRGAQRTRLLGNQRRRQPRRSSTRRSASTVPASCPNSGSYELCYPQRENLIVGNTVYSNNQSEHSGDRRRTPRHGQRGRCRGRDRQHRSNAT